MLVLLSVFSRYQVSRYTSVSPDTMETHRHPTFTATIIVQCTRSKLEIMKTSRGCYDAQLFRRCAGRIVMVSCCCVCPQFFLSALPPRGSINNKHFCNNFQQKQIITLSGIDNVVSCYLSKNHNL